MAAPLLFCIAEEARPVVYKVMNVKLQGWEDSLFNLVESRNGPRDGADPFKRALGENEPFEPGFIGASEEDCQAWALDMQAKHNFIEQDLIGILDKRSASDETLLIQFYSRAPGIEVVDEGVFPKETDKWHDFRIRYQDAEALTSSLQFGASDIVYPVYFGRKEELTDERGVFDVSRAEKICIGEES